jgi:hypothetical protein
LALRLGELAERVSHALQHSLDDARFTALLAAAALTRPLSRIVSITSANPGDDVDLRLAASYWSSARS